MNLIRYLTMHLREKGNGKCVTLMRVVQAAGAAGQERCVFCTPPALHVTHWTISGRRWMKKLDHLFCG
jgi:hypothetical protein